MKRTNRFPLFLLMLVLLLAAALLASCGGDTETPKPDTPTPDNPPEHTHAYTDTVTAPTCTEPGYTTHTYSCGHSYTDTPVPATGHTEAIDPAVAPTKTEDGRTEGSHCSACHIVIVPQNSLHATGSLGLAYTVNEDGKTCTVTGIGTCTDTELVIPAFSPEDLPVTAIGAAAFKDRIDDAYTDIIILGNVLTEIGEEAFSGCSAIRSINIPDSVTRIDRLSFADCASLASITIPDGVTKISDYTFFRCYALTSITVPDSVTEIGKYAFTYCHALTGFTIPDSVTKIGNEAFQGCSGLTYTTYDNAKYLGNTQNPYLVLMNADGTSITSCTIHPDTKFIDGSAFRKRSSLANIVIPDGVVSIGDSAFRGCSSLANITIPGSVVSIEDYAFYECPALVYTTYDNAKYLGNAQNPYLVLVKASDTNMEACTIHPDTKIIYFAAFFTCNRLTGITIPRNVISIGNRAFFCGSYFGSLVVEEGNEVYHSSGNCIIETASKTLVVGCNNSVIPSDGSVTKIGRYAFSYCRSKDLIIPEGVTEIDDRAFDSASLRSITLPDSVTKIGNSVFYYCSNLKDITFTGTRAQWKAISKNSAWKGSYTASFTVHCTDGDLTGEEV